VFNLFNRTNLLAAWQTNALEHVQRHHVGANKRQMEMAVLF
jgi:hypothetical protein